MRKLTVCVLASLVTLYGCATDQDPGVCTWCDDLAGAAGAPVNRPQLEYETQQQQSILALEQARAAQFEAEARNRRLIEQLRLKLSFLWQKLGYSEADAIAFARAYHPSASDDAVLAGVRAKGSGSAGPAIKKALGDYNYRLADELLLDVTIVYQEEKTKASASSSGQSSSPPRQ